MTDSASPMTLNGLRVVSVRLFVFWRGAWEAEVEIDPDDVTTAPTSGPATLAVAGQTLTGSVDARASGTFVNKAFARVVGGAGAWDQTVPQQDFAQASGVLSTTVYQQTASLIGETVADLSPATWGSHVIRSRGPASRVFGALDWWVDLSGVTNVGARSAATPDASFQLIDFHPIEQRIEFTCEGAILLPGTTVTDARLNGATLTTRDVEQVFDRDGSRGMAWCASAAASPLTSVLQNLIVEIAGRTFLRIYRYRLVLYQGSSLALQAVSPAAGVPDLVPLPPTSGLAGAENTLAPSQEVWLAFDHSTEPPRPFIVAYDLTGLPLTTTVDAQTAVHIAPSGTATVDLAGGANALVPAPWATGLAAALAALATALTTGTLGSMSAGGSALTTALGMLPPDATVRVKAT